MLLHEDAMNILFTRLFLAVLCLNGMALGDFFERTVEIQYSPRAFPFLIRSTFYLGKFFTVRFLPFCDLAGRARCYRRYRLCVLLRSLESVAFQIDERDE